LTHKSIPACKSRASGVSDSLIRLSVGLEDVEDLITDLEQAFSKLKTGKENFVTSISA
jgi:cystathionine beta-lyase/cystathionine gamma-synthase